MPGWACSTRCWWPRSAAGCWPACRSWESSRPRRFSMPARMSRWLAWRRASFGPCTSRRGRPATWRRTGPSSPTRASRVRPRRRSPGTAMRCRCEGTVAFVPDAPGADLLVVVGRGEDGSPSAVAVPADADGVSVEAVDALRRHPVAGSRRRSPAPAGRRLSADEAALADAWYVAQALLAAESVGAVQTCLDTSVAYAKERFTFGRAIGSYQAIKHRAHRDPAPPGQRPQPGVLRRLGPPGQAGGVPAGGQRRALGGRRGAGLRRPRR